VGEAPTSRVSNLVFFPCGTVFTLAFAFFFVYTLGMVIHVCLVVWARFWWFYRLLLLLSHALHSPLLVLVFARLVRVFLVTRV
jgi:hypothetical protein